MLDDLMIRFFRKMLTGLNLNPEQITEAYDYAPTLSNY